MLAFSIFLYYTVSCRKVIFYNPLLIIYTPLKRPMAPPSVFYYLFRLFSPFCSQFVHLSFKILSSSPHAFFISFAYTNIIKSMTITSYFCINFFIIHAGNHFDYPASSLFPFQQTIFIFLSFSFEPCFLVFLLRQNLFPL